MSRSPVFFRSRECPVRRQVAARLAAEIRDGTLPPGERLPGVRTLAERLGVHRHTVAAAYRELSRAGLLRAVSGSGTFVAETPARSFPRFLARERAVGRSAADVGRLLGEWERVRRAGRLAVVDPEAGLRALAAREAEETTGLEVAALTPGELPSGGEGSAGPGKLPWAAILARRRHLPMLAERCPPWTELLPLPLRGGAEALTRIRSLPPTAAVAIVTRSRWLGRHYRALLAGERARGIALVRPDPGDARGLHRARRIAALLLADASCLELPELAGCRRVRELRLLRRGPLRALAGWLAPDAPEGAGEGGSDG